MLDHIDMARDALVDTGHPLTPGITKPVIDMQEIVDVANRTICRQAREAAMRPPRARAYVARLRWGVPPYAHMIPFWMIRQMIHEKGR